MNDPVNSPEHYRTGKIECIEAIEAALTPEEFRGYVKGNVIKYTWRERHKGGNQSLAKAVWYLQRLLQNAPQQSKQVVLEANGFHPAPYEEVSLLCDDPAALVRNLKALLRDIQVYYPGETNITGKLIRELLAYLHD